MVWRLETGDWRLETAKAEGELGVGGWGGLEVCCAGLYLGVCTLELLLSL